MGTGDVDRDQWSDSGGEGTGTRWWDHDGKWERRMRDSECC